MHYGRSKESADGIGGRIPVSRAHKKANSLADELAKVIDPLSPYQKAEIIERALLPCPMDILKILRIR